MEKMEFDFFTCDNRYDNSDERTSLAEHIAHLNHIPSTTTSTTCSHAASAEAKNGANVTDETKVEAEKPISTTSDKPPVFHFPIDPIREVKEVITYDFRAVGGWNPVKPPSTIHRQLQFMRNKKTKTGISSVVSSNQDG